jgi:3-methylcrotonyl-CoA carboxylase alpha subunit
VRSEWRDGDRTRVVEITPLGGARYRVVVDGTPVEIEARAIGEDRWRLVSEERTIAIEVTAAGARRFVRLGTLDFVLEREAGGRLRRKAAGHGGGLEAPMPGLVTRVMIVAGDEVKKGQPLVALEAMKMEHVIRAPRDGRVSRVAAQRGEMVQGGVALVELEGSA